MPVYIVSSFQNYQKIDSPVHALLILCIVDKKSSFIRILNLFINFSKKK